MTLTENFEPDNIKINSPELLANHHECFLFSFAKAKLNVNFFKFLHYLKILNTIIFHLMLYSELFPKFPQLSLEFACK